MQSSHSFRMLIILTIPFLGDNQFTCDGIVRSFSQGVQHKYCSCVQTMTDVSYYPCRSSNESCFRCLNSNVTISQHAVCDNVVDCPDLTDELLCLDKRKYDPVDLCRLNVKDIIPMDILTRRAHSTCGISNSWKFILSCEEDYKVETSGLGKITESSLESQMYCCPYQYCSIMKEEYSPSFPCYNNRSCDPDDGLLKEDHPLIVIGVVIGTTAVFLNSAVIFVTAKHIHESRKRLTREERLTKYFFLSLAISDIIVAISITFSSSVLTTLDGSHGSGSQRWISSCDAIGALSLIGCEQSVFTMVLITLSRIWGVARPFSRLPMKSFVILLLVSWALSIIIAVLPLMKTFEDIFVIAVWQKETPFLRYIARKDMDDVTNFLLQFSQRNESSRQSGSWAELRELVDEIFGIELYKKGFYQGHHKCLLDLFQTCQSMARAFSLMIFITNFVSFFFMMFGYLYIFMKQQPSRKTRNVGLPIAKAESEKLKRKIFYILATDFICWIPVCIYGLLTATADLISWRDNQRLYFTATYILLPINSAVNPIIYSGAPDFLNRICVRLSHGKRKNVASTSTIPMTEIDRVSVCTILNPKT